MPIYIFFNVGTEYRISNIVTVAFFSFTGVVQYRFFFLLIGSVSMYFFRLSVSYRFFFFVRLSVSYRLLFFSFIGIVSIVFFSFIGIVSIASFFFVYRFIGVISNLNYHTCRTKSEIAEWDGVAVCYT